MEEESKQSERFDFDGFWKDLIERFWRELLKSVLPTLYAVADLTKEPVFLDKELRDVMPLPDEQNAARFVDALLKIPLKGGGEAWVLLHIEVQGPGGENLTSRMFGYLCLIYGHYGKLPVALAILTAPRNNETTGVFEAAQHGTAIRYQFNTLELDKLDDGKLLASDNPFDLALYAARRAKQSRNDERMKFRYLRELRGVLGQKGWSGKDVRDLLIFIERIINLKDLNLRKEYTVYTKEMEEKQMAYESWIEKHFRDEGRAEGEKQGEQRGILKTLAGLIRDGILTIRDAALRANMTEDEFVAQMAALGG